MRARKNHFKKPGENRAFLLIDALCEPSHRQFLYSRSTVVPLSCQFRVAVVTG
jgi:hypothetical protein